MREIWGEGNRVDPTGLIRLTWLLTGTVFFFGLKYFQRHPESRWYWHWLLSSLVAIGLAIVSHVVMWRRMDEFERAISNRSVALAGRAMLIATVIAMALEIRTDYSVMVPGNDSFYLESIFVVGLLTELFASLYFLRRLRSE